MSAYSDYASTLNVGSSIALELTTEWLDILNAKNNKRFEEIVCEAFVNNREVYEQDIKMQQDYYSKIIDDKESNTSEVMNAKLRLQEITENFNRSIDTTNMSFSVNHYKEDVKNTPFIAKPINEHITNPKIDRTTDKPDYTSLKEDLRFISFNDRLQFDAFQVTMEQKGVGGIALTQKHNGQYVYVIPNSYSDIVTEYEKVNMGGIELADYRPYEVRNNNALKNGSDGTVRTMGSGIQTSYVQSLESTDNGAMSSVASKYNVMNALFTGSTSFHGKLDEDGSVLSANVMSEMDEQELLNMSTTSQLALKWNDEAFNQALTRVDVNSPIILCADEMEFNLDTTSRNAFAKSVSQLQSKILQSGNFKLDKNGHLIDKNGQLLDFKKIKSMTDKEILDVYGITRNQLETLCNTMQRGVKFKPIGLEALAINKVKEKLSQDVALVKDSQKAVSRSFQLYRFGKTSKQTAISMRGYALNKRYNTLKKKQDILKRINPKDAKKVQTKLDKAKRANDKFIRQEQRRQAKNIRRAEKTTFKASKEGNRTFAKFLNKRNEFYKKMSKSVVGRVFTKINAINTAIYKAVGSVLLIIIKFEVISFAIFFPIILIVGLTETKEPDVEDSVAWRLNDRVEALTSKWTKKLTKDSSDGENKKFLGIEFDGLADKWDELLYTEDYLEGEDYIKSRNENEDMSLILNEATGKLYINVFKILPNDRFNGLLKEVTDFDGGYSLIIIPAGDSIHSNNTKELLCMADTWFELDMDGNGSLTDDAKTLKKNGKLSQEEWKKVKRSKANTNVGNEEELDAHNYATWGRLSDYVDLLYDMSHQECFDLEVVVLPCKEPIEGRYLTPYDVNKLQEYDEWQVTNMDNFKLKNNTTKLFCPDYKKYGCQWYNAFIYKYYGGSGGCPSDYGLSIFDGEYPYYVGDIVTDTTKDEFICTPADLDFDGAKEEAEEGHPIYNKEDYKGGYSIVKCWYESDIEEVLKVTLGDEFEDVKKDLIDGKYVTYGDSERTYSEPEIYSKDYLDGEGNYYFWWIKKTGSCSGNSSEYYYRNEGNNSVSQMTEEEAEKSGKTLTRLGHYQYTESFEVYGWSCNGHEGRFCGGHVKLNTKGYVYSFTGEQIDAVADSPISKVSNPEAKPETTEIVPKLIEKNVDFSSISTAQKTGANSESSNVVGWNVSSHKNKDEIITEINSNPSFQYVEDIFDVDLLIRYGEKNSILSENYKDFTTWTGDNMELALLKYTQVWADVYGFDIDENLGCFTLTDEEITKIEKNIVGWGSFSSNQKLIIDLALKSVGNGAYDMNAHNNMYRYKDVYNVKTDASGFADYFLMYATNKNGINESNPYSMKELIEVASSGRSAKAGDILIKKGTALEGSQVYVYIGCNNGNRIFRVDEFENEVDVVSGTNPMYVCLDVKDSDSGRVGNIYLENAGNAYGSVDFSSGEWYTLHLN